MQEKTEQPATIIVDVDPSKKQRNGVLTVMGGSDAGKVLSIPKMETVTLGRDPSCTYPFDDASLSRVHASVMRVGNDYILRDSSTNGSFVNDSRVAKIATLEDGDRIQLGSSTMLRFHLADPEEEQALQQVYLAAVRDGLTGALNRKALEERLFAEIQSAVRQGSPLSLCIADIDFFKRVNDTYGHLGGDAVLQRVSELFSSRLRRTDAFGRYGGEEFVILLPGTPVQFAAQLAETLRRAIEAESVEFEGRTIKVTSSFGVASIQDCPTPSRESLLGIADGRLYRAKSEGRNLVIWS